MYVPNPVLCCNNYKLQNECISIRSPHGLHLAEYRRGSHGRHIQARSYPGGFLRLHGFQILQNRRVHYN